MQVNRHLCLGCFRLRPVPSGVYRAVSAAAQLPHGAAGLEPGSLGCLEPKRWPSPPLIEAFQHKTASKMGAAASDPRATAVQTEAPRTGERVNDNAYQRVMGHRDEGGRDLVQAELKISCRTAGDGSSTAGEGLERLRPAVWKVTRVRARSEPAPVASPARPARLP